MTFQLYTICIRPLFLVVVLCTSFCTGESAWAEPGCGDSCSQGGLGGYVGTPAPLGTYSHMWQCGQVRSAHNMLSIHKCDWLANTDELSPFMRRYLVSHITNSQRWCGQIAVEPSSSRALDEQRRVAVVDYLAQHSLAIPIESVTVAYGTRDRLRGDDANHVLDNFGFQRNQSQSQQFNPNVGFPPAFGSAIGNAVPTYGRGAQFPGVGAFLGQ